jgi:site-specific DNA-methyltransferase (adenine-specific)
MNGDCLELMKGIPDGSVDMVLTDPPYGMDYQSNRRVVSQKFVKIENDKTLEWVDEFVDQCHRVMKNDSALYFFCSWHNMDFFKVAIERKFKLKNILVWVKNNHGSGDLKAGYAPKHEFIFYAHKGRSLFREKRIPDVLEFPKIHSSKLVHPTEKNIDMLELLAKQNSDVGQVVLDPFMGSGTTGVACVNTGRKFIGIEMDDGYFEIARKRIAGAIAAKDLADATLDGVTTMEQTL